MPAPSLVSVVVPTYNERPNVELLIPRLAAAMKGAGFPLEVIVADDKSPDGTADAAEAGIRAAGIGGRALRREGPRGLSPAVMDGFGACRGEILGVMDADLSHPPEVVPEMVRAIVEGGADLAVGSRYVRGGGVEDWPWKRRFLSRMGGLVAKPVTRVRDATSGFFFLRRGVIEGVALDAKGFKIGLEIFVKGNYRSRREVPFVFRDRIHGESKLGGKVMALYGLHLLSLFFWRLRHLRFGWARRV
ncbi:MAG: polyprenol monophosphomannose synthase [Planctomycetales bacterium]|nr:polyprenol monophosphomannose synthase [Planctomycetales bacterium]